MLGQVCRLGLWVPVHVQPSSIVKADRIDDHSVALPYAYRITQVGRLNDLGGEAGHPGKSAVVII